jgi:hypothetical protein
MILAYLSHDEVNQLWARQLADAQGIEMYPLFLKETATASPFDAVVHDLDSLPPADRQAVLKDLLAGPLPCPAAVHSYGLEEAEVEALRARGVVVHCHLEEAMSALLAVAARQATARSGDGDVGPTPPLDLFSPGLGELPASGLVGGRWKRGQQTTSLAAYPTTIIPRRDRLALTLVELTSRAEPGTIICLLQTNDDYACKTVSHPYAHRRTEERRKHGRRPGSRVGRGGPPPVAGVHPTHGRQYPRG